jgi:hypothetical protein
MDPSKVDENAAFFEREVLPELKAQPGFQAARNMINRETGEGAVGTIWADAESLDAAARVADSRRERAAGQGVTFGEQTRREVLLGELP